MIAGSSFYGDVTENFVGSIHIPSAVGTAYMRIRSMGPAVLRRDANSCFGLDAHDHTDFGFLPRIPYVSF